MKNTYKLMEEHFLKCDGKMGGGLDKETREHIKNNITLWSVANIVLNATVEEYYEVNRKEIIPISDTIVCLWKKRNYQQLRKSDIQKILSENPPKVTGFETVENGLVYIPIDGNHRIIVAEEEGLQDIPVTLSAIYKLPKRISAIMHGNELWIKWDNNNYDFVTKIRGELEYRVVKKLLELRGLPLQT